MDDRRSHFSEGFLAHVAQTHAARLPTDTLTEEERAKLRADAAETLTTVLRLRENVDFQSYERYIKAMVEEKKRVMLNPDLEDSKVARARVAYLTAVEFANVLAQQELTCRTIIQPGDARVRRLAEELSAGG